MCDSLNSFDKNYYLNLILSILWTKSAEKRPVACSLVIRPTVFELSDSSVFGPTGGLSCLIKIIIITTITWINLPFHDQLAADVV